MSTDGALTREEKALLGRLSFEEGDKMARRLENLPMVSPTPSPIPDRKNPLKNRFPITLSTPKATPSSTPDAAALLGTWNRNCGWHCSQTMTINKDGSYRIEGTARSLEDHTEDEALPTETGRWKFSDDGNIVLSGKPGIEWQFFGDRLVPKHAQRENPFPR